MPELPTLKSTAAMASSVQDFPTVRSRPMTIIQIASIADEIPPWWSPRRDYAIDRFWPTEPFLAGAIFSIASRNASFRYELTGPREQVKWAQQLFAQADFGRGWHPFIMKVTLDLLTTGNGAFIEVIRPARMIFNGTFMSEGSMDAIKSIDEDGNYSWHAFNRYTGEVYSTKQIGLDYKIGDSPLDLPVGIAHLDSMRCTRTGNPSFPVIYQDMNSVEHALAAHQVITLEEMPSPREEMNQVQHSAVDRALLLAQTLRDMLIYKHEKVSGRFARAIHLTNIDASAIQDAVDQANENADNKGLYRYLQPIIATTLDPNATPAVQTIELASMPDGFNEQTAMQWYIAGLALDFGVDFGFLAPLPGNKLGTSTQAEVSARQARGKSSRLFLNMLQYKFNFSGILPQTVSMRFNVPDPLEESERDRAYARRARARSTQIKSGEITPEVATQMAADVGDVAPQYLPLMGLEDITPIVTVGGTDPVFPAQVHIRRPLPKPEPEDDEDQKPPVSDGGDQEKEGGEE